MAKFRQGWPFLDILLLLPFSERKFPIDLLTPHCYVVPMKIICFVFTVLLVSSFNANSNAVDLGREMPLADSGDEFHTPRFEAKYALPGETLTPYQITYGTRLAISDLAQFPRRVLWNIYLKDKGIYLDKWSEAHSIPKLMLIIGNWYITDSELVKDTLIDQSNAVIVFAKSEQQPIFNLDLGKLCIGFPNLFQSKLSRCDKITPSEIGRL